MLFTFFNKITAIIKTKLPMIDLWIWYAYCSWFVMFKKNILIKRVSLRELITSFQRQCTDFQLSSAIKWCFFSVFRKGYTIEIIIEFPFKSYTMLNIYLVLSLFNDN